MSNLQYNRWHVYQYCKDEFMFSGEIPTRDAVKLIFVSTDPEEIDEGVAEFEAVIHQILPKQQGGPRYGERLTDLRHRRGLTQRQLAVRTGITRAAISHYEKNRREPNFETLMTFADFFRVTIDYIVRGEQDHVRVAN